MEKMHPLISVVIPIYNVEKYLGEALDSVIGQSYANLEIICVNDGSTDSCQKILNEYIIRETRLKVISQENRGTFVARKRGVETAKGEYILFMDPDDTLVADACQTVVNILNDEYMASHQLPDIVQFGCNVVCPEECDLSQEAIMDIEKSFNRGGCRLTSSHDMLRKGYIEKSISYNQCCKAIKADVTKKSFSLVPDIKCVFAEDMCTGYLIFSVANFMVDVSDRLYNYRVGVGISTNKIVTLDNFKSMLSSFDMLKAISCVTFPKEEADFRKDILDGIYRMMMVTCLDIGLNRMHEPDINWIVSLCNKNSHDTIERFWMQIPQIIGQAITNKKKQIEMLTNSLANAESKSLKRLKDIRVLCYVVVILVFLEILSIICLQMCN